MTRVAALFTTRDGAVAALDRLHDDLGIEPEKMSLLTPTTSPDEVADAATEGDGTGASAVGAILGGATGTAIGAGLASALIPGIGWVAAAGFIAASLLSGAGGAVAGAAAGEEIAGEDRDFDRDYHLYEDALRRGESVVVVHVGEELDDRAREVMAEAGGVDLDHARETFWDRARVNEEAHLRGSGIAFEQEELSYRRGFEAGLSRPYRSRGYDEAREELMERFPWEGGSEAFRLGYERGREFAKRGERETPRG